METLPLPKRAKLWLLNFPRRFNRWYHSGFGRHRFNPEGVDVIKQDWDNLLILDACRHDTFAEVSDLPGRLEQRVSRASTTQEFMKANIGTRDLRDTVYVTATPAIYAADGVDPKFHAIVDVWEDGWDPELRVVPPGVMTATAIEANKRHPNKRLIVHYIQPHYPFIGPTGQNHFDHRAVENLSEQGSEIGAKFWETVGTRINDVPESVVREAYRENLEITLPHIYDFLKSVSGKTVVTADHGEMLNERLFPIPYRIYGHPPGHYVSELVDIPWHIYTKGPRRRIISEDQVAETDIETGVIQERLRDLGYA